MNFKKNRLHKYLNQKAIYRPLNGIDYDGNPIWSDLDIVINVREEQIDRFKILPFKYEDDIKNVYYTTEEVFLGSKINNNIIKQVKNWVDKNGEIVGYKVYVTD